MALAPQHPSVEKHIYTEDEYFEFEQTSLGRWEYVGGEIRAINIDATLRAALFPHGYRVFGSDMKVHTGDGLNTFPDIYALIEWVSDIAV